MDKRGTLINLLDFAMGIRDGVESMLTTEERLANGTYETWSAKDTLAHVALWLGRDLKSLDMAPGTIPFFNGDTIDGENRRIHAEYRGKTWEEINDFYRETFGQTRKRVIAMREDELLRDLESADGSKRPVWRAFAGHALMHVAHHFARLYVRGGEIDRATQLEEKTATLLAGLDASPEWLGRINYNLACHYSLIGQSSRAIDLLKDAFSRNPEIADWSTKDPDLDSLRDNPDFASLYQER